MVTFEVTNDAKLPAGEYLFRLMDVGLDTEPSQFGNGKPRMKWIFRVESVLELDDENEDDRGLVGTDVWQWTTNSMRANSTQYAWIVGMMGKKSIEKGQKVDSQTLVDQVYKVTWGDKHYTIQQTGESGTKTTILTIKPHRNRNRDDEREPVAAGNRHQSVERSDDEDF